MIATYDNVIYGYTQHHNSFAACMSADANRKGSTPSPPAYQQQHFQPEEEEATQQPRSAMMASYGQGGNISVPIRAQEEERIQIAGGGSGVHVNDVLCGRGKVSFNHRK